MRSEALTVRERRRRTRRGRSRRSRRSRNVPHPPRSNHDTHTHTSSAAPSTPVLPPPPPWAPHAPRQLRGNQEEQEHMALPELLQEGAGRRGSFMRSPTGTRAPLPRAQPGVCNATQPGEARERESRRPPARPTREHTAAQQPPFGVQLLCRSLSVPAHALCRSLPPGTDSTGPGEGRERAWHAGMSAGRALSRSAGGAPVWPHGAPPRQRDRSSHHTLTTAAFEKQHSLCVGNYYRGS
jgi:hypothetical protein